jgi:hypothetical protein
MNICNSGGAIGSDSIFEEECLKRNVSVKAFSYKTPFHKSISKVEISDEDYLEGINEIKKANKIILKRTGIDKYMNLLARNWAQVKYSEEIYAIGKIIKPKEYDGDYQNKSTYPVVSGGTGYAVAMGITNNKIIYVFDQTIECWFRYSYVINNFIKIDGIPEIKTNNFAGIGTRKINEAGKLAIKNLINKNFGNASL